MRRSVPGLGAPDLAGRGRGAGGRSRRRRAGGTCRSARVAGSKRTRALAAEVGEPDPVASRRRRRRRPAGWRRGASTRCQRLVRRVVDARPGRRSTRSPTAARASPTRRGGRPGPRSADRRLAPGRSRVSMRAMWLPASEAYQTSPPGVVDDPVRARARAARHRRACRPVRGVEPAVDAGLAREPEPAAAVERRRVEVRARRASAGSGKRRTRVRAVVDADDRVQAAVGDPGRAVRPDDHAVRRRAGAECDAPRLARCAGRAGPSPPRPAP